MLVCLSACLLVLVSCACLLVLVCLCLSACACLPCLSAFLLVCLSACLLVCYPRIAALLALRLIVLEVRYFDIAVRKQQLMEVPVACSAGVPFVAFWGEIAAAWAAVLDSLRGTAGAGAIRA